MCRKFTLPSKLKLIIHLTGACTSLQINILPVSRRITQVLLQFQRNVLGLWGLFVLMLNLYLHGLPLMWILGPCRTHETKKNCYRILIVFWNILEFLCHCRYHLLSYLSYLYIDQYSVMPYWWCKKSLLIDLQLSLGIKIMEDYLLMFNCWRK